MQNDEQQHGCDDPNCPVCKAGGLAGFKILTGKGTASFVEAIKGIFGGQIQDAEQRQRVKQQLTGALKTVLQMQAQAHDDVSDDIKAQALIEALCGITAMTVATYSLDFVQKEHGLSGEKYQRVKKLVGQHIQEMLEGVCRHGSSACLLSVGIERMCLNDKAQAEQARNQAESN